MVTVVGASIPAWGAFLLLIILILKKRDISFSIFAPCFLYICFIIWSMMTLTYSAGFGKGIMMIVKYVFPLFIYALTLKAISSFESIKLFFNKLNKSLLFYLIIGIIAFFYGGQNTVQPYYGMSVVVIAFASYFVRHSRKDLLYIILCIIPPVLVVKRTPLLGIALAGLFFLILRYKWKAIIPSVGGIILSVFLIFQIPQFKEKIFYSEDITFTDLINNRQYVEENLNTNGRNVFWEYILINFYEPNKVLGCGSGTVKEFIQSDSNIYKANFLLVHNDWLVVLCENGIIGVCLLASFFLLIFFKCYRYSKSSHPPLMRLMACICAGSLACTVVNMYFENCMNSFVYSTFFVFYAIFNFVIKEYRRNPSSLNNVSII